MSQLIGEQTSEWLPDSEVSISSFINDKRGMVLLFWSGICSHCQRYDLLLNNFEMSYPELGLLVVACRQEESLDQVLDARARRNLTFQFVHDRDCELAGKWFVNQTPRAFLIDQNHKLLYRGAIDNYLHRNDTAYCGYLSNAIGEFLDGKTITKPETQSFGCPIRSVYYSLSDPTNR